ncbi:MAG: sorbosone dehydrogenase family protein [Cyclobacteriaceae bacterium]
MNKILQKRHFSLLFSIIIVISSCSKMETDGNASTKDEADRAPENTSEYPLESINLPDGFEIDIYAEGVKNARSMAMSPNGTLFIGTRNEGNAYAVTDSNGDNVGDEIFTIARGLEMPNGVAFKDGDLYLAEVSRLWKYENIESNLKNPGEPKLIYDDLPTDKHHGWKYIAFGPDDKLYVPVGAPCNICESRNATYAAITKMDADGSNREIVAHGVRNTVGFTWHPETGDLWFTDNGRDMLGNDMPPCELNRLSEPGQHFGYPYCHGGTIKDPEFGDKRPCSDFVQPAQNLGPHVAPLGIKFYTGEMFPAQYKNVAFIAEHGSWNRDTKIGYRISMVTIENNQGVSYDTFIDGWLDDAEQEAWGRPVDILFLEDGSMLISDDKAGVVYRVTYTG